jgi:D-aminoacyl-tRNA deacylase
MRFAIVYSKKDEAGINIAQALKNFYLPQVPIIELSKDSIYSENFDENEEKLESIDFIIFATKHQSKETRKTLSLHAPGNWRNADYGGKPFKICKTSSLALKFLFQKMEENRLAANSDYELTLECTHHGPLITKPCCFIEIGSTLEQWQDKEVAKIIAKTIADFQNFQLWKSSEENKKIIAAMGVGGPHYCPNFNKIQLSKDSKIAIGHIIPEYQLPLNETMLSEAIEKTKEHLDLVLLDWKGCGNSESRQKIINIVEKMGLKHERIERIEK